MRPRRTAAQKTSNEGGSGWGEDNDERPTESDATEKDWVQEKPVEGRTKDLGRGARTQGREVGGERRLGRRRGSSWT